MFPKMEIQISVKAINFQSNEKLQKYLIKPVLKTQEKKKNNSLNKLK